MSAFDLNLLKDTHPLLAPMMNCEELFWINPLATGCAGESSAQEITFTADDVAAVEARLQRFRPYLKKVFPQTEALDGLVESPLKEIPQMHQALASEAGKDAVGRLLLKCDSMLPISGSIKARGGFHEILKLAETIAIREGMLTMEDDYSVLAEPRFRELFSKYSVAVGSTGNLGLSIGIMSAQLGFHVTIHMSADARQWKKDMLREKGAVVVEYPDDYQKAVAEGRKAAAGDPLCHFVDDEGSADLFLG